MRRILDDGLPRDEREPFEEFRPSKAQQKQESKRLRPVAVLPALALLVGAGIGVMTDSDRLGALFIYLGLFGFSGAVAAIILAVLLPRNRRFLANARIRISAHAIEYTNARGKVIAFDRADSSLRALLAWVLPAPNSEGINLPSSLMLFVSDQTHSIRLHGSDWEIENLRAVVAAANTRFDPSARERRSARKRRPAYEDADVPPLWDQADESFGALKALSAKQVNELIPGTMSFRETHPLTFALIIGFGSVALLLLIIVGVALAA
jgi:hypothetical protein